MVQHELRGNSTWIGQKWNEISDSRSRKIDRELTLDEIQENERLKSRIRSCSSFFAESNLQNNEVESKSRTCKWKSRWLRKSIGSKSAEIDQLTFAGETRVQREGDDFWIWEEDERTLGRRWLKKESGSAIQRNWETKGNRGKKIKSGADERLKCIPAPTKSKFRSVREGGWRETKPGFGKKIGVEESKVEDGEWTDTHKLRKEIVGFWRLILDITVAII